MCQPSGGGELLCTKRHGRIWRGYPAGNIIAQQVEAEDFLLHDMIGLRLQQNPLLRKTRGNGASLEAVTIAQISQNSPTDQE